MCEDKILFSIKDLNLSIIKVLCNLNKEYNIPVTQMRILSYIYSCNDDVYQKDLEKNLNLTRATISGILNTMEKNGLIKRCVSDRDLRSRRIELNNKSIDIFRKNKEMIDDLENIILKGLNSSQIDDFKFVMEVIKCNVDNFNEMRFDNND